MPQAFQVVDLFAGPGGLAEGFSAYRDGDGHQPFNIVLSVEKEASAHRTLLLRSFLRQFDEGFPPEYYEFLNGDRGYPDWSTLYPEEWANATEEAVRAELGTEKGNVAVRRRLAEIRALGAPTVIIGGPPCQAYSLVGRARNKGKADYVPGEDKRHFLYQEYIDILSRLRPAAFVMENVKGMLSSSIEGDGIFESVLKDLRGAAREHGGYELFAIGSDEFGGMVFQTADAHRDYIVEAEKFGVPQARHRVIIVGLRRDLASRIARRRRDASDAPAPATVRHVLAGMPPLRSGLSSDDADIKWRTRVSEQMQKVCMALIASGDQSAAAQVLPVAQAAARQFLAAGAPPSRQVSGPSPLPEECPRALREWLADPLLGSTTHHSSRAHMADDLGRYFFSAVFAQVTGRAPKADEFPEDLAPAHANWSSGIFKDRFRAQPWDGPSTTVTSHISKDGHYFIHPDAQQCRSFTVREAARLQTFPDNYYFLGSRTEQYTQVGNAVPPFLARQIAAALWNALVAEAAPASTQSPHGQGAFDLTPINL
ncbi:DNA cytosine methyltransferase [Caulobacter sp. 17J65-9]|uniref:DNA cytosine methyltransferase n=1 Tax=Caulobacter sp. 17J65-9 TaxID=2709382 RepID=UPI0013C5ED32|nr:DNA cytosine methyltransferase [Caulobacter sp. 17J65-9]NEX92972.1 DNA cytosine methyltransferase [Caulobacter sp. 17J65-9]